MKFVVDETVLTLFLLALTAEVLQPFVDVVEVPEGLGVQGGLHLLTEGAGGMSLWVAKISDFWKIIVRLASSGK